MESPSIRIGLGGRSRRQGGPSPSRRAAPAPAQVERLEGRTLLAAAPPVVAATAIAPLAGSSFTGTVATFTDPNASETSSDFAATIDWGDKTATSAGTISAGPGGGFVLAGTHTYTAAGNFTTTVTVFSLPDNQMGSATGLAVVNNPVLAVTASPSIKPSTGLPFVGTVATFTDTDPSVVPSNFIATIDWGDGSQPSAGTVSYTPGGGGFNVTGTHTYTTPNATYPVVVTIARTGTSQSVRTVGTATVSNATLTATGVPFTAGSGVPFTGVVASLADSDTSSTPGDFAATIDWGDGTTSAGTVAFNPTGGFNVSGPHTYALVGTDQARITVVRTSNGQVATTTALATVNALPQANINGAGTTITPVGGVPFTGPVALFLAGPPATAASFVATIDWGDGQTSAGTIVPVGAGAYDVVGSHTYGMTTTNTTGTSGSSTTSTSGTSGSSTTSTTGTTSSSPTAPTTVTVTVIEAFSGSSPAKTTITSQALIQTQPFTGGLNPLSDTGVSDRDGITRLNQIEFSGTALPYSLIDLYSQRPDQFGPVLLGQAAAAADGTWNIFAGPLANGHYAITATVVPPNGSPQASVALPPVTIDTLAPQVSAVTVDPRTGNIVVIFRDDRSGMDPAGLADRQNYDLLGPRPYRPGVALHPSRVSLQGVPADPQAVAVTLYPGGPRRNVRFVRILSSGIADTAGNPIVGGDFVPTPVSIRHSSLPRAVRFLPGRRADK
jgi:hypothetical protein